MDKAVALLLSGQKDNMEDLGLKPPSENEREEELIRISDILTMNLGDTRATN